MPSRKKRSRYTQKQPLAAAPKQRPPLPDFLYPGMCLFVSILLVWRAFDFLPLLNATTIGWKTNGWSLTLVISFHLTLFILAFFYEKIFKACHFLFIYMVLILSLYLLFIFNCLFFYIPDQIWIRLSLLLMVIPVVLHWKRIVSSEWCWPQFSYKDILIALWGLNTFLFFARYNLDIARVPFIDELNLWYVAARDMIERSVMFAHGFPYPGGGAYPLGIPFISSLPAQFWGSLQTHTIYFMPVVNILCLVFFLRAIKVNRWTFLFFICALSAVFYQKAWLSYFLYGVSYGDGISTIFLLITTFQWLRISDEATPSRQTIWWMSLGIGLLALTKGPLTALTLPIFLTFLIPLIWTKKFPASRRPLREIFFAVMLAILPSLTWKTFTIICPVYTQNFSQLISPQALLSRLLHPDQWMLANLLALMWGNSNNFFYYGPIAIVLYAVFSKRIIQGVPLLILFIGAFLYYAYFYNYGANKGDPGSSLRYIMPAFLALFYLGACGFENAMQSIERGTWSVALKTATRVALCLLLICGLHETRVAEKIAGFMMQILRGFSA